MLKTKKKIKSGHSINKKDNEKQTDELTRNGYYKPVDMSKYSMPAKAEVEELYGNKIRIEGLDKCSSYRKNVIGNRRYIAAAGLFNTGTNLLFKLLQRNCYIPERWPDNTTTPFSSPNIKDKLFDCETGKCKKLKSQFNKDTGMRDTVPWWKHGKVEWRDNPPSGPNFKQSYFAKTGPGEDYDKINALPIVMIKDPVNWMSSMCRNPYSANFYHRRSSQCPSFDNTNPADELTSPKHNLRLIRVSTPRHKGKKYSYMYNSLVDMWNKYYGEWMHASFPNLIVRYEDLLFHPEEVITQVCECGGGVMRDEFQELVGPAKKHGKGIMGRRDKESRTDSNIAAIVYGTKEIRNSVLNSKDRHYTRDNLDRSIMHHFRYPNP